MKHPQLPQERISRLGRSICIAASIALSLCSEAPGGEAEKAAAAKVASLGGKISYDADGKVTRIMVSRLNDKDMAQIDFSAFTHLKGLWLGSSGITNKSGAVLEKVSGELETLSVYGAEFTDKGLAEFLDRHTKLKHLVLMEVPIGDESMPRIGKMRDLQTLSFWGAKVTDKGLKSVSSLASLRALDLSEMAITDAGMAEVAKLETLWFLSLYGTKITDRGIANLAALSRLRILDVRSTAVGEEAVEKFQVALPDVKVKR